MRHDVKYCENIGILEVRSQLRFYETVLNDFLEIETKNINFVFSDTMGKEHNIRRTTWVFTFMVVVSLQTYTKYLNTLYQNPHIQTSLPPPKKNP